MTKSIIEIAREAELVIHSGPPKQFMEALNRFAALVKAAHLEEITGVEMPEPTMKKGSYGYRMAHANYYTEAQLKLTVAAAVARKDAEIAELQSKYFIAAATELEKTQALTAERDRLREALGFYAIQENWVSKSTGFAAQYDPLPSEIEKDRGSKARAAVEGKL